MSGQPRPVYLSSKGPMAIDSMPYPYLKNAYAKALREGGQTEEVRWAMDRRLAELDALATDEERIAATTPKPQSHLADALSDLPSHAFGHNKPPVALDTFQGIADRFDDLMTEAKNWLDGAPIVSQAQADEVSRLQRMVEETAKAADTLRRQENDEFDKGKAAVQAKYAPLIADNKSAKGLAPRIVEACKAALTPWLNKIEDERLAALKAAEEEAAAKIETVAVLHGAADASNLADAEVVEEAVQEARGAVREVKALEGDRARVGGGAYRATLLKDNWVAILVDGDAALAHYWKMRRGDIEAMLTEMAGKEVKVTVGRAIPGFNVENQKRAA